MKIYGLTTCVGDTYARYLINSIPRWSAPLDQLLIVTDEQTFKENFAVTEKQKRLFLVTDIFTRYGASFNKGAALSQGFAQLNPSDWVLNFDADALPPWNWRDTVEKIIRETPGVPPRKLFGVSHRYREDGAEFLDADFPNIWGFVHLWNIRSPYSWQRPVFDVSCGHAGNYDHTFMMQWPVEERVDLWPALHMIHQGEPRTNWFGRDPKWEKKMFNLITLGLWDAWQSRAGHVEVPKPLFEVVIDRKTHRSESAVLEALQRYTTADPFKYRVTVKE
jgi:hypothetical protein